MPKNPSNIQFSMDQPLRERLQELRLETETSIGLTAKRLLTKVLIPTDEITTDPRESDDSELEAITDQLSVLTREIGNCFIAYKEIKEALDSANLEYIQKSLSVLDRATENNLRDYLELRHSLMTLKSQVESHETRLVALEQAPGRSQKKRDANGRFLKKGETDE